MAVVLEHAQAIALDLRVGRVDIHHLDAPGGEGVVGKAVIQPPGRLWQAVGALQARPAVGTAEEFLRQGEFQLAMPHEVGKPPDAKPLGAIFAHGERIGVVEAERHAGRKAIAGERAVQLLERRGRRKPEDLGGDGAGVLRVEINRARFQRGEHDAGVAEAGLVLAARHARQHLAENVGLREALRADAQALLGLRGASGEQKKERAVTAPRHRAYRR